MTLNNFKIFVATIALLAGPAIAGDPVDSSRNTQADTAFVEAAQDVVNDTDVTMDSVKMPDAQTTVAELIGSNVLSASNETVGEIDYLIDTGDGYAAVIGLGGVLGLGEYTVAVAMEEFVRTETGDLRLVNWTGEQLGALPEIDETELENLSADHPIDISR